MFFYTRMPHKLFAPATIETPNECFFIRLCAEACLVISSRASEAGLLIFMYPPKSLVH